MGYFFPDVLGVGYDYVDKVLNGDTVLKIVALLGVLKIVGTATCYASGNAGGIFGPSLFIGAMMGAATGGVAHHFFPGITAGPGAYALVGMGTAFAGIIRTPFTSVIMIFELTRDYTIIVPLMISNTIAYFISQKLQHDHNLRCAGAAGRRSPAQRARPRRRRSRQRETRHARRAAGSFGAIERAGRHRTGEGFRARSLARIGATGSPRHDPAQRYAERARARCRRDDAQRSAGRITVVRSRSRRGIGGDFAHVHPDHSLHLALERMGSSGFSVLPVVSRASVRQLMGIVVLDDVLKAYGVAGQSPDGAAASPNGAAASPEAPRLHRITPWPGRFNHGGAGYPFIAAFVLSHAVLCGGRGGVAAGDRHAFLPTPSAAKRRLEAVRFYNDGERLMKARQVLRGRRRFSIRHRQCARQRRLSAGAGRSSAGGRRSGCGVVHAERSAESDSMGGAPNLAMARVFAKEGQFDEAAFYYHRAIYGQWKQDAAANRVKVRFELANLLARRNREAGTSGRTASATGRGAAGRRDAGQAGETVPYRGIARARGYDISRPD